jgi:hypothetical protein
LPQATPQKTGQEEVGLGPQSNNDPKQDIVVAVSGHLPTNRMPQVQCCKVSPCEEWGGCTWTKLSFSLTEKPTSG